MNKDNVYKILERNKIPIPNYYLVKNYKEFIIAIKSLGYPKNPVCFKPSQYSYTGGGRGFRVLRNKNTIDEIILRNKPGSSEIDYESAIRLFKKIKNFQLLVMEYLPGKEYSCYVFAKNGTTIYSITNLRERVEQSYSFEAIIIQNKKISQLCKKIIKIFNFSYNINIQFKISKSGNPKVIEINPRIGGTIVLPVAAGVNLPYLGIKLALNEKITNQNISFNTKMIRYWKEFFTKK